MCVYVCLCAVSLYPFRCPWLIMIAITSLTNLNVIVLMPWVKRELHAHPTRCSYVTCSVLGYYEALGQLCVGVRYI